MDVGRFSVKTKAVDSVEGAVRMWNPMCQASIVKGQYRVTSVFSIVIRAV